MRVDDYTLTRPFVSMGDTVFTHGNYTVRRWTASDREKVAAVIQECLESYGLEFEAQGADLDAIDVEEHYLKDGRGEFWVVVDEHSNKIVGSGGYYEINHESKCEEMKGKVSTPVEIRKMYLLPEARGKKLGRMMLEYLERRIAERGYRIIYIETASVLKEACKLYTSAGYRPVEGVETERCDQRLYKNIPS